MLVSKDLASLQENHKEEAPTGSELQEKNNKNLKMGPVSILEPQLLEKQAQNTQLRRRKDNLVEVQEAQKEVILDQTAWKKEKA